MRFNHPQKPHPPRRIPSEKKKSPNSLRRIFNAVRNTAGVSQSQISQPHFLDSLVTAWQSVRQSEKGRYGVEKPTRQIFRATENGTSPLYYWQIENYAHSANVPSAVFLMISRLTEGKRHELDAPDEKYTEDNVVQLLAGFRRLLSEFENKIAAKSVINDADIRLLIDAYLNDHKKG